MKRIVRQIPMPWQGLLFGLSSLLLVGIIEKETVLSYLIVLGLTATMAWQGWTRHRLEKKSRATPRKRSRTT